MPKVAPVLSDIAVRNIKEPGLHSVGGVAGLKIQVTKTGGRSWILKASIGGVVREMGLGSCSDVSMKQARELAREARVKINDGNDPIAERKAKRAQLAAAKAKLKTFDQCAEEYISLQEPKWKGPKQAAQWRASIRDYASPFIGKLSVSSVDTAHIMNILNPIWVTKTETASRVRARIESILSYATTSGYRSGDNPARLKDHLDNLLPKAADVKQKRHHAALPYSDIGRFMLDLRGRDKTSARALEFSVLTACRSGEIRGAKWAEIDYAKKLWTIPANRMKAKKEHVVPLSAASILLLKKQQSLNLTSEYVFPGKNGQQLSDMTISKLVKTMHQKMIDSGKPGYTDPSQSGSVATPHGFRSTFREWAAEQSKFPREVIEHALAHQLKDKAEAAYQRGSALPKRVKLMEAWSKYCSLNNKSSKNVTPMTKKLSVQ